MNCKLISMIAATLALGLGLAGSSYAADLSNFTVATAKYGTAQPNGSSCLYVTGFIPAELGSPFLGYTLVVGGKNADLANAMMVTTHRTINFDFGPTNPQCQEFDGFAGALSILRPGAP